MGATRRVFVLGIVLAGVGCNGVDNSNFHLETDGGIVGTGQPGNPIRLADTGIMLTAVSPLKADGMAALGGMLALSCPTCLTGMGTAGALAKFNGGTKLTETGVTEDGDGNLSIGPRTASKLLEVHRDLPNDVGIYLHNDMDAAMATARLDIGAGGLKRPCGLTLYHFPPASNAMIGKLVLPDWNAVIQNCQGGTGRGLLLGTTNDAPTVFMTASTERMRIDSRGNVGINTDNPGLNLEVKATDVNGVVGVRVNNTNQGDAASGAYEIYEGPARRAGIYSCNSGVNPSCVGGPGAMHVANFNDGPLLLATKSLERMRILGNGNIGIGTTAPATMLDINGVVTCRNGCMNGSSRELKQDVAELSTTTALAALSRLRPSQFVYKATPNEPKLGFIAEDVPDLVAMNDRKSLDPMEFAALLTKVVQEQQKQLAAERTRNDDLQRRIERLESALAKSHH